MKYKLAVLFILIFLASCVSTGKHGDGPQETRTRPDEKQFVIHWLKGTSGVSGLRINLFKEEDSDNVPYKSLITDPEGKVYFKVSELEMEEKYYISLGKNDRGFRDGRYIGFKLSDSIINNGFRLYLQKKIKVITPTSPNNIPIEDLNFQWNALSDAEYYKLTVFWGHSLDNVTNHFMGYYSTTRRTLVRVTAELFRKYHSSIKEDIYLDEPVFTSEKIFDSEYRISGSLKPNGYYFYSIDAYDKQDNVIASNGFSLLKTSPKYIFNKNKQTSEIDLNKEKFRAISLSAILNEINNGSHNTLEATRFRRIKELSYKKMLNDQWSVYNGKDLLEAVDRVSKGGHSKSYNEIAELIKAHPKAIMSDLAYDNGFSYTTAKRFYIVKHTLNITKGKDLRAWDLSRCINLARWGYQVHYITEKQAWDIILPTARKIYPLYSSWKEFAINYIAGRMFWSSIFLTENEKRDEAIEAYHRLLADSDLPKRKSWGGDDEIIPDAELYIKDELDFTISKEERAWNLFLVGHKALKKNKIDEAKSSIEKSLELYPRHSHVYYTLGYIYSNKNEPQTAQHYFEQAIYRKNDVERFYIPLSNIYIKDNIEKAVELIESGLKNCKEKNSLKLQLINLQFYKKDYEKAIEMAKSLIDSKPSDINVLGESYAFMAQAYLNLGDYDKALDNISYAEVYLKEQPFLSYLTGLCYLNKGPEYYNQAYKNLKIAERKGFQIPDSIKGIMDQLEEQLF